MNRFTTCGNWPQRIVERSSLLALFLLVFSMGCASTEPSDSTLVGTWALVVTINGGVRADSVAGQWTFRADGTQSGWQFIRAAGHQDVDGAWSGVWDLTGSNLHTMDLEVAVPRTAAPRPVSSPGTDYTVTFGPNTMTLRTTLTGGIPATTELIRQ